MEKEILYRFFDGTATHFEEMQVRKWLDQSGENRREFLKERMLFDMLILNVDDKSLYKSGELSARHTFIKNLLKIAAAVALTFAVTYAFLHQERQDNCTAMLQTVSVPAGQRVDLTLADGTKVWLNAMTTLVCDSDFGRKNRTLQLDGEGYFEVAKDATKPFTVKTKNGEIIAKGTSFNVQSYSSDAGFETTLMEGSVEVRLNNADKQMVTLSPGQKATLKDGKFRVDAVDDLSHYRWRNGLICFNKNTFVEIMRDFEKYYGVEIEVVDRAAMKNRYTGKFRSSDGIEYALKVLQKDIPFKYRRDEENRKIYIE